MFARVLQRGVDHDGDRRILSQHLANQRQAILVGQADIHHRAIRRLAPDDVVGGSCVRRREDAVAQRLEFPSIQAQKTLFVINEEKGFHFVFS